jgi:simple sugar transport system substrate-binding protein
MFFWLSVTSSFANNTYYLITHGSQDPYWTSLFDGAKQAAKDLNVQVQVLSPPGANDVPKQLKFIESVLATDPLGIATTIPSNTVFSKSLKQAESKHIPIIAVDTKPSNHQKNPYLAFLGSDNFQAGKMLAMEAIKHAREKERAVILNPQPGHVGLEMRAKGIKQVLSENNMVVEELDVGTDANFVQSRVKSYFLRHPNTTILFCLTSQALDPIGQMLLQPKKNNFNYKPLVFSFDKTPNTLSLIDKNVVAYAVDQQPFLMGYLAIAQLVLFNKFHLKPVNINTAT